MYLVRVFHGPACVGEETVKARSFVHAHVIGSYISRTVAQAAVHPSEYHPARVSYVVLEANK